MSLHSLPDLLEPWTDADLEKLSRREAIYVFMLLEKKRERIEDRVERDFYFMSRDKKKYSKIFNFAEQQKEKGLASR
jgi:hypothetical protein